MSDRRTKLPALALAGLVGTAGAWAVISACTEQLDYTTDDGVFVRHQFGDLRDEALARYRTVLELHTEAIFPSCTPNGGVCHNSKEYPDMHTPGNFLTVVARDCNVSMPDPRLVDNGCEPIGDQLRVLQNDGLLFEATVGFAVLEEYPAPEEANQEEGTMWSDIVVTLDDELPFGLDDDNELYDFQIVRTLEDGSERILVDEHRRLLTERNSNVVRIMRAISWDPLDDDAFLTITTRMREGDRNQDGVYGGQTAALIAPGDPENSFLLWRVTGRSLPPMPLANNPLREAAVAALICWIEQLASTEVVDVEMEIDYENCDLSQWTGPYRYAGFVQP